MSWPPSIRLEEVIQGRQTLTFDMSCNGESHPIMFEDSECEIVLRHEDVDRRSQEILDRYRVPADRSPDLMAMKPSPAVDPPAAVAAEVTTAEPPASPTSAASQ
jgi:hypothetical protein